MNQLYRPKDYRTNRKAVLDVRKKFKDEMRSKEEIEARGIPFKDLKRWMKAGKLRNTLWKGRRYYHFEQAKQLFLKENLLPGMQGMLW